MKTFALSKIRMIAVLLSFIFVLTACGGATTNSADFANPNKAVDAYLDGQNIVGLTVNVTAVLSDTGTSDGLCSFYSDGYNGSFKENVLVYGRGAIAIEKGESYTIKITEVRKSNNTYAIEGDFVTQ